MLSLDRETELSGAIHDKGFLTLRGDLEQRYGGTCPLTLSARVTFEQSYAGVERDLAASAELYALLSSLAGIPLRQGIAVTGRSTSTAACRPSARSTRRSRASTPFAVDRD